MGRYAALLRGINVGGKNVIKMAALKACFEAQGFAEVGTYIQSGNVVFSSPAREAVVVNKIAAALAQTFNYRATLAVRSLREMRAIIDGAPNGFGTEPARYRYDVLFLMPPLKAPAVLKTVPTRTGVDQAFAGTGVLYFSRLIAKATQSQLSRLLSMPIYQQITIRNWNTTTALLRLMDPATSERGPR